MIEQSYTVEGFTFSTLEQAELFRNIVNKK